MLLVPKYAPMIHLYVSSTYFAGAVEMVKSFGSFILLTIVERSLISSLLAYQGPLQSSLIALIDAMVSGGVR